MIIEKFLEQAEEAHAHGSVASTRASNQSKRALVPAQIAGHRLFPIAIAGWSGLMLGASAMVLDTTVIARFGALTGFGAETSSVRLVLAGLAALTGAVAGLVAARRLQNRVAGGRRMPNIASKVSRTIPTIDPATDLGSESLDAPLEEDIVIDNDVFEFIEPDESEQHNPLRREMTLEEFGALPGRNAVWVQDGDEEPSEEIAEEVEEPIADEPREVSQEASDETEPRLTALEKLRAVPPQDLSVIQMVERFAAALQDQRDRADASPRTPDMQRRSADRDRALVEALKALSTFSERGFKSQDIGQRGLQAVDMVSETEAELREALSKLQTLRGAA